MDVSMEALRKICACLSCNIGDIVEFVDDSKRSPDSAVEEKR